ncbi:MFS transporter [Paenibacillus psychroresistens]|nr:MFS transporter [Paenibacillus psychroresistens]
MKNQGKILIVTCLALFMTMLDTLVLGVALPSIQNSFHADMTELEWFLNAYTLTFAVFLIPASLLGERFGRKRMFILGVLLFTIGSILSGFSDSALSLSIARAVQGFGGAFIMPISLTLVYSVFSVEKRAAALGIWSGVSGLGLAIGPLVGGAVIEGFPWQMIFWLNIPIGILVVIFSSLWIPESRGSSKPFDVLGVGLLGIGLFGIVYGLVMGNTEGWGSASVITSIAAGLVLLLIFARRSLKQAEPMINLRFFKNRNYLSFNLAGFWMSAGIFGSIFILTLFLQQGQGFSPLQAGVREMAWTGMTMIMAPLAGLFINRLGSKNILIMGLVLQLFAMLYFAIITLINGAHYPFTTLLPGLMMAGAGMGLSFTPLSHGILTSLAEKDAGEASGVSNAFRELGGVFGVAIAGLIFQMGSAVTSQEQFADHLVPALFVCSAMIAVGLASSLFTRTYKIGASEEKGEYDEKKGVLAN